MRRFAWMGLWLAVGSASAGTFADVPADHPAYEAVEHCARTGVLAGGPDSRFEGQRDATRYEYAELLRRVLKLVGVKPPPKRTSAADVPADHWAAAAVSFVAGHGVLELDPQNRFGGERALTRYELAPPTARAVRLFSPPSEPAAAGDLPFADVPREHWAYPSLLELVGRKVIEDTPDHLYRGSQTAARYDLAMVASGLLKLAGQ